MLARLASFSLFPSIHQTPVLCILKPDCTLQGRATQLTADNSRRAGELELVRLRREHEENQVSSLMVRREWQNSRGNATREHEKDGARESEGQKCAGVDARAARWQTKAKQPGKPSALRTREIRRPAGCFDIALLALSLLC